MSGSTMSLRRASPVSLLRGACSGRSVIHDLEPAPRHTCAVNDSPWSRKRAVRSVAQTVAESVCATKVAVAVHRACWVASSFPGSGHSRGSTSFTEK